MAMIPQQSPVRQSPVGQPQPNMMLQSGQNTGYATLPQNLTNATRNITPNLVPANVSTPQNMRSSGRDAFAAANRSRSFMPAPTQATPTNVSNTPNNTPNYTSKVFAVPERRIVL